MNLHALDTMNQDPSPSRSSASSTQVPRKITYLPTTQAYDRWAQVYDSDSNPLQALDDIQLTTLLPEFLALVLDHSERRATLMVDLGCGTGRNTAKLLSVPKVRVIGLDASENMLHIARGRCTEQTVPWPSDSGTPNVRFELFDMLECNVSPDLIGAADAIISTLVLEHIPLGRFFSTIAEMLVPEGYLLLTNMHADMGAISQAGFLDPGSGEKVRPVSYAHVIEDVLAAANLCGLDLIGKVLEKSVEEEMLHSLGKRGRNG